MLRSVFTAKSCFSSALPVRALSTQAIQPPKTPVNLAHLSDNHGAVSEVTCQKKEKNECHETKIFA